MIYTSPPSASTVSLRRDGIRGACGENSVKKRLAACPKHAVRAHR